MGPSTAINFEAVIHGNLSTDQFQKGVDSLFINLDRELTGSEDNIGRMIMYLAHAGETKYFAYVLAKIEQNKEVYAPLFAYDLNSIRDVVPGGILPGSLRSRVNKLVRDYSQF